MMFDVSPDDKSHPKWVICVQRSGGHQPSGHRDVSRVPRALKLPLPGME